jgi:hypothetical protein
MVTQTLVNPATIFNKVASLTARLAEKPIHAKSHDYGFDYNEAELAAELRAPLPKDMVQYELADVSNTDVENSNLYLF